MDRRTPTAATDDDKRRMRRNRPAEQNAIGERAPDGDTRPVAPVVDERTAGESADGVDAFWRDALDHIM